MLNWRFVKAQFQHTWVIIFFFGLSFLLLVGLANVWPSFGDQATGQEGGPLYSYSMGAANYLNTTIFGMSSLAMFMSFGSVMGLVLINTDINSGHIGSWLTTPMSRIKVFNSKLFVLISSVLLFNLAIVILEMISFSIRMPDFNIAVGHLLLGNLTLLIYSLMITAGTWLVCCLFQKNRVALGIIIALFGWFMLCLIMSEIANPNSSLKNLEYFKYFTIQSLFNSPLKYGELPDIPSGGGTVGAPILPLKALDFAWQLPVMFVAATGLYFGGQFIIKKKDFAF